MELETKKNVTEDKTNGSAANEGTQALTWQQKTKQYLSLITVEPFIVLFLFPAVLSALAVTNLNLDKACRVSLSYDKQICDDMINLKENVNQTLKENVQIVVSKIIAWKNPLQASIPAIVILFIGAWSDKTGRRKICMIIPILGELLMMVGLILSTFFFLEWTLTVAALFESLPPALTGGHGTMLMAVFSYLADVTTVQERTFRMGMINVILSITIPFATLLSGFFLNTTGYYGVFVISLLFVIAGIIYASWRIKDKLKVQEETENNKGCIKNNVHLGLAIETFMVLFKKRENGKRLQICLLIISVFTLMGPVQGLGGVTYLYMINRFNITPVEFSVFLTYNIIINSIGVLLTLSIFSKKLQMSDSLLASLACLLKFLASFLYTLAPSLAWFYLGPIIELCGGVVIVALRSMVSKVVEPDEVGKINSLVGLCDAVATIIYVPIFSGFLYPELLKRGLPQITFIIYGLMLLPPAALLFYLYRTMEKENVLEKNRERKEQFAYSNENTQL